MGPFDLPPVAYYSEARKGEQVKRMPYLKFIKFVQEEYGDDLIVFPHFGPDLFLRPTPVVKQERKDT